MRFFLFILIFVLMPGAAFADFFSYKDDQGKTHYTDSAAKVPPQYRQEVKHEHTFAPKPPTAIELEKQKSNDHIEKNEKSLKKARMELKKYNEEQAEIKAFAERRLKVGPHSNLQIDKYCKDQHDRWQCRKVLENALNELSRGNIRSSAELRYCKIFWGMPRWDKIKDCYNRQLRNKEKYKSISSETIQAVISRCDDLYEDGNWAGKNYCLSNFR